MTDNHTELTIENSAVVLTDHQPWVAFSLEVDSTVLINNVTAVARSAKTLGVPTVLTTVGARGASSPTHLQPDQRGPSRDHPD
jgi:hypothetical protein